MSGWIKAGAGALASAGAWLCYLLGGWDAALKAMFLFMLLDYVTGVIVALLGRSVKTTSGGFWSQVAFLGITKKLMMIVLVILASALDRILGVDGLCRIAAIGFYIANEGFSIVENAALLGVPFPRGLLEVLARLKSRSDAAAPGDDGDGEEDEDVGRPLF